MEQRELETRMVNIDQAAVTQPCEFPALTCFGSLLAHVVLKGKIRVFSSQQCSNDLNDGVLVEVNYMVPSWSF